MGETSVQVPTALSRDHRHRLKATGRTGLTVSAAVLAVLYGLPIQASAEQASADVPSMLEEVMVTATRRTQAAEEVPYSLSVIDGEALTRAGVDDLKSLALQVPGLSMFDFGARYA